MIRNIFRTLLGRKTVEKVRPDPRPAAFAFPPKVNESKRKEKKAPLYIIPCLKRGERSHIRKALNGRVYESTPRGILRRRDLEHA